MTSGTKILLALIGLFVGILVLYYGFLMPSQPPGGAGLVRDPALETSASSAAPGGPVASAPPVEVAPKTTARQVKPLAAAEAGTLDRANPAGTADRTRAATGARTAGEAASVAGTLGGAAQVPGSARPAARGPAGTLASPTGQRAEQTTSQGSTPTAGGTAAPRTSSPTRAIEYTRYVVQDGDTMTSIAEDWFGDQHRWDLIARANSVDPNRLKIGQVLRLPPRDAGHSPVRRATNARDTTHTVRAGDSLSSIAFAYYGDRGRWKSLYAANRDQIGRDPHALEVGMTLRIP